MLTLNKQCAFALCGSCRPKNQSDLLSVALAR
jgi:hypothetical protein